MSEEKTAKAVRGLTIAVWALTVVMVISLVFPYVWTYVAFSEQTVAVEPAPRESAPKVLKAPLKPYEDEYEDFYDWPIEKQISTASAIILTRNTDDGERIVSTVEEVLMVKPGTTLYYQVGDEYKNGTHYKREGYSYGEGEIVFMTGSPARMRYSTSYSDGRCGGLGDMPIEKLRELIAAHGNVEG